MGLLFLFLLGIGNFAAQGAAWNSRHPLLHSPLLRHPLARWVSLGIEFSILTGAMLIAADGGATATMVYAFYTAINLASAWLIHSGRI